MPREFTDVQKPWVDVQHRNPIARQPTIVPGVPIKVWNDSGQKVTVGMVLSIHALYPVLSYGNQAPAGVQGVQGYQSGIGAQGYQAMDMSPINTQYYSQNIVCQCKEIDGYTKQICVAAETINSGGVGLAYVSGQCIAQVLVTNPQRIMGGDNTYRAGMEYAMWYQGSQLLALSDNGFKIVMQSVDYSGFQGHQGPYGAQGPQAAAQLMTCLIDLTPRQGRSAYPVYNADATEIPDYSLAEIRGMCGPQGEVTRSTHFKVGKPATDSLTTSLCIPTRIAGNQAGVGSMEDREGGIRIAFDTADGTPTLGSTVGTKSGSYKAKVGGEGFVVLDAYVPGSQAAVPVGYQAEALVYTRPFRAGGGTAVPRTWMVRSLQPASGTYGNQMIPPNRLVEIVGYQSGWQAGYQLFPAAYLCRVPSGDSCSNTMITLGPGIIGPQGSEDPLNYGLATYDPYLTGIAVEYDGNGAQAGVQGYQEVPQVGRRLGTLKDQTIAGLGLCGWVVCGPAVGAQTPGWIGPQGSQTFIGPQSAIVYVRPAWG